MRCSVRADRDSSYGAWTRVRQQNRQQLRCDPVHLIAARYENPRERPMSKHYTLTEQQWQRISLLLPKLKSRGRPWRANRDCLEGILWILRTGARWKDLPKVYPSPATCWRRLRMWEEGGVLRRMWRALLAEIDYAGHLDWKEAFADATFVPAKKGEMRLARQSAARVRSACS